MLNKKWMILSLLIGNLFLISIAMSGPMYIGAVTQNLLTRSLSDSYRATGEYPALFTLESGLHKGSRDAAANQQYYEAQQDMAQLEQRLNTPALYRTEYAYINDYAASSLMGRADSPNSIKLFVSAMTGLEDHVNLIEGQLYSDAPDEQGVYDALVSRTAFVRKRLAVGEVLEYQYVFAPDGTPLQLRVAGVFDGNGDSWWDETEDAYVGQIFVPMTLFRQIAEAGDTQQYNVPTLWKLHIDYEEIRTRDTDTLLSVIDQMNREYNLEFIRNFRASCEDMLRSYRTRANQASATLKVLQVPVFALLIAFIFMVSRQILESEQTEISVLKSRGASGGQILQMYLSQGLILAAAAFVLSVPFSAFLCRAIGSASAFLEFSNPAALRIRYDLSAWLYALAAAALGVMVMVLPAVSFSRLTIVDAKRGRHAMNRKPWWQKCFLDFILTAVSLYGLYTFNNQKALLAEKVAGGAALDPLLYISSSLFAVGASLIAVRLIPMIASVVFRLFRRLWSPALYASFLQILRNRQNQAFMMCFVMLTISIGMLNADTACTVNASQEEQLRYDLGADVVLQESWRRVNGEYQEPDAGRYSQIDGVESMAQVLRDDAAGVDVGSRSLSGVQLMGIDTRAFGQTAWMKDGLLDRHFFSYLNDLSQTLNGCLVSSNFRENLGLEVGDSVSLRAAEQSSVSLTITGFVDYFPAYQPTVRVTRSDGAQEETDQYLVVANFGYLRSCWGVVPYEIWLKAPNGVEAVSQYAAESGNRYLKFTDIDTQISDMKHSPSIQGTNGILTLSFIIGLTLCAAGFLIFWILSIRSRSLQFGIYRAMGMSVGELIALLINEHLWQSVISMAAGAGIGVLVSRLYIPLIQLAYSSADATLPLQVYRDFADHIRLIAIILGVLVVCVCILVAIIRRLRMAQAIKLGED